MARFVLIPGADGRAWYWHRLVPCLHDHGHETVAVDLPATDPTAGLEQNADAVMRAIGDQRTDLVLVAQSLAGFTAPLVAERVPVELIVLLNAMVPSAGESAGEWWQNTGHEAARAGHYAHERLELPDPFDPIEAFFHDVPTAVVAEAMAMGEQPVRFDTLFTEQSPLAAWPGIRTRFLQARDDRFLPLEFQRRVVAERLGIPIDVIEGGHLVALSRPDELAHRLDDLSRGSLIPQVLAASGMICERGRIAALRRHTRRAPHCSLTLRSTRLFHAPISIEQKPFMLKSSASPRRASSRPARSTNCLEARDSCCFRAAVLPPARTRRWDGR